MAISTSYENGRAGASGSRRSRAGEGDSNGSHPLGSGGGRVPGRGRRGAEANRQAATANDAPGEADGNNTCVPGGSRCSSSRVPHRGSRAWWRQVGSGWIGREGAAAFARRSNGEREIRSPGWMRGKRTGGGEGRSGGARLHRIRSSGRIRKSGSYGTGSRDRVRGP